MRPVPNVCLPVVYYALPWPSLTFHPKTHLGKMHSPPVSAQGQDKAEHRTDVAFVLTFLISHILYFPALDPPFQELMTEVCAQFVFLTKKNSMLCLRCVGFLLPVSCYQPLPCPMWFIWLALVDRKPSGSPPQDQGLPFTPVPCPDGESFWRPQKQSLTPLILCVRTMRGYYSQNEFCDTFETLIVSEM
jgi:hypothetical protein